MIYTGPGPTPVLPAGADQLSDCDALGLLNDYIETTGDRDAGDMELVAAWITEKYGPARGAGFLYRAAFAF